MIRWVITILCCGMWVQPAIASELVFAYSLDGSPISSTEIIQGNKTGKVLGYCRQIADYLQQQGYTLHMQELTFEQRFGVFAKTLAGRAGIQCGPSSRTRNREAKLVSSEEGYRGAFSNPFLITSAKLLIRNSHLEALYQQPDTLRIGVLKPQVGMTPVTTELIGSVFATAQVVGLPNRTEAVQRLMLDPADPQAIDAYATDEVLLRDMLRNNIPAAQQDAYRVEPPLQGYSREEYVLVVYNAPELLEIVNTWIGSAEGQRASTALLPDHDSITRLLAWLQRGDHLDSGKQGLLALLLLLGLGLAGRLAWRKWQHKPTPTTVPEILPPALVPPAPPPPEALPVSEPPPTDTPLPGTQLTPRETEILVLLVRGMANKDVARELALSPRTVETHRKNIYTKLGVRTPYGLVEYAQQRGLV